MSNSSINATVAQTLPCNEDPWVKGVFAGIDRFETPVFFIVGFFSRLISLASIYRERKTEKAYFYQIYVLGAEAVEILFYFLFQLARTLSTSFRTNAHWFQRCYACMWCSTRLANTLLVASKTNTNLLTLAMTLDRAYAVWRPMNHPLLPHAIIRKAVLLGSAVISVLLSLYASFILGLSKDDDNDGLYVQVVIYLQVGFAYTFLSQLSSAFDTALLIGNVLANVLLCYGFRKGMKNRASIRDDNANSPDEQWKTLFKMTFCQSLCNTLGSLSEIAYHALSSFVKSYTGALFFAISCLAAPFNTAFVELMDIVEFCLIMAVSKKFRSMVFRTVKRMVGCKNTQNQVMDIRIG